MMCFLLAEYVEKHPFARWKYPSCEQKCWCFILIVCLFLAGNVLNCEVYSGKKLIFFFLSDVFLSDSLLEVKFNRANWRDLGEPRDSL